MTMNLTRRQPDELVDRGVRGVGRRDCRRCADGQTESPDEQAVALAERRGWTWVVGSFLLCPCHLPLTLGLATTVLGGTVAGAMLRAHPVAAGVLISVAWLIGTWHGVRLLRAVPER
jgi:hypothetical protein